MVDVGSKSPTERRALARATVRMSPSTVELAASGRGPKGEVFTVARIAGIQAAKRTAELIPLCHPLPLSYVDVALSTGEDHVTVEAEARTTAQTGVEMEALTAATVAALTIYDMVKGIERGVTVDAVQLVEKTGGKEDWRRA